MSDELLKIMGMEQKPEGEAYNELVLTDLTNALNNKTGSLVATTIPDEDTKDQWKGCELYISNMSYADVSGLITGIMESHPEIMEMVLRRITAATIERLMGSGDAQP